MAHVRSTLYVAIAQAAAEGLGLVRNVILARALGPAEMGVVAALTLTLSLLDMISDFGPDRLLVQAEDGDREEFQATSHLLLLLRGVVTAGLLLLLSMPVGGWLARPDAAWMIATLTLVPLIRGAVHLDSKRVQRRLDFRGTMLVELSAACAATAAALVLAPRVQSAAVLVWVSLVQVVVLVGMSHFVAERPYRVGAQRDVLSRLMGFGWPLAMNGVIMFGALQGDRLVVMASASTADLGRYAVAFQLTMVPALLISRVASTVWLPWLSRCQGDAERFEQRVKGVADTLGVVALVFSLGILTLGNPVIRWLYGADFVVTGAVMMWLGTMQGIRILRAVPSLVALSRADSFNPLVSNLLRFAGIAAAAVAGMSGGGLSAIAACGCGGEMVALVGAVVLLKWRHQLEVWPVVRSSWNFTVGVLAAGVALYVPQLHEGLHGLGLMVAGACLVRAVWAALPVRGGASGIGPRTSYEPVLAKTGN